MQSKKQSLIESVSNVSSGLILSWITWRLIITPIFKIYPSNSDIFIISLIFTIISIIRSYVLRRLFNNLLKK